jgi:hypothetical protein
METRSKVGKRQEGEAVSTTPVKETERKSGSSREWKFAQSKLN